MLGAASAPGGASARTQRKRPKLTFEMLKESHGLPEVYHNFPDAFRQQFRGKGHEVSDLRRLLEMYNRWQQRVFPLGNFDSFIATVETIGVANVVKKDMSDMRMDLLKEVEDHINLNSRGDQDQGGMPDGDIHDEQLFGGVGGDDYNDNNVHLAIDSDDELLEMAAARMGGGGGMSGAAEDDIDDDELLEMAAAGVGEGNGGGAAEDDIDDDELLELAMQG